MKKRLRAGREADRHRSAPHRPGAHAACRGRLSPAAAARHQRRDADRAGACRSSPKAWSTRPSCASAATGRLRGLGARSSPSRSNSPEAVATITGVPAGRSARRGAALRHRRQRRDLLRPRRHRAQPGLDRGDGDRQPRDGDRQYRPAGRRREPAARPEQRAGLAATWARSRTSCPAIATSPTTRRARMFESAVGRHARSGAGPAHPQHARRRGRRHVQGPLHPGRGHPAVRSQHASTSRPAWRRWNASSCRTCS